MAARYQLVKRYERFLGLDLRSSEVIRSPEAASRTRNAQILRTGSLTSRKGYKAECSSSGGLGTAKYTQVDTSTGAVTVENLIIGAQLYKLADGTVTLTYTGSAASVTCSVLATASNTIEFTLEEDGSETFSYDLGKGFDEVSPIDLAALKTQVDALTDFAMSISGTTSVPAAFLPTLFLEPFVSGSLVITFCDIETVNQPATAANPFNGASTNRTSSEFTICSSLNKDNVLYIASRYDTLKKYDGQKVYRAGMPVGAEPTAAQGAAGNPSAGDHGVFISYVQIDKQGNRIEGDPSPADTVTLAGANQIDITVTNLQPSSGFNTDCAIVNGAQAGVTTVTVDSGHTLKVGDVAYFYDGATTQYVTRTITAVTTTTIAFTGAVDVADNAVISANLRIAIYVTAAGGSVYYLSEEIPNDSTNATQVFSHNLSDVALQSNAAYVDFVLPHTLPPQIGYITMHQGLAVGAGIIASPNTVYFQDIDSPEYWPIQNSFNCETIANDKITGLAPSNEFLAVFKKNAHFLVSGLLATTQYRVDLVSTDIGCIAHATIQEVEGRPVFCSRRGPYRLLAGGIPQPIGEALLPVFTTPAFEDDYELQLTRAIAINDEFEERYVLFLPAESTQGGNVYANGNSRTFIWDYYRERVGDGLVWLEWDNLNMSGGALVDGNTLRWVENGYSDAVSNPRYNVYRRNYRNDQYDAADHAQAVDFEYVTGWESLGEPSVYKKALRTKIFSVDPVYASFFTLRVRTERNYIENVYDTDLTMEFGSGSGSSGWSFTPWSSIWGDPAAPAMWKKLRSGKCTSLRYTLSHDTLYEIPLVTGWETEFVAPFKPAVKE